MYTLLLMSAVVINPFLHGIERKFCFSETLPDGTIYGVTLSGQNGKEQVNIGICGSQGCSYSAVFDPKVVGRIGWLDTGAVGVEIKRDGKRSKIFASIGSVQVNRLEQQLVTSIHEGSPQFQKSTLFHKANCRPQGPVVTTVE
jgi:hypothetical protein